MLNATKTPSSSTQLFEHIVEEARHPKARKSAERVREACTYLHDHRIPISISEVGRLCFNTGPKEQSIRNNKKLSQYVWARAAEQNLRTSPNVAGCTYESSDVQANAIIYALQAEARRQKTLNENLKRAIQNAGEYDLAATVQTGRLVRTNGSNFLVERDLADALRRLLDPEHLACFGLTIEGNRVLAPNRNNRVFMTKADFQKLVAASSAKPSDSE